jgi:hypothetical protein
VATIHLTLTTTATPEQFIAAVTDFGPGRSELFGNSADEYLKVHDQGPGQADVTEGSGGIWERLHYDWSNPKHRQGHRKSEPRRERGGTHIDAMDPPRQGAIAAPRRKLKAASRSTPRLRGSTPSAMASSCTFAPLRPGRRPSKPPGCG